MSKNPNESNQRKRKLEDTGSNSTAQDGYYSISDLGFCPFPEKDKVFKI